MLRLALVFSLIFVAVAHADERRSGVLLDEVVAVFEGRESRVLLLSDLQIEARLMRARTGGGASLRAPVDAGALSAALDFVINEFVIVDEAARLQLFEPSRAEVDAAVAALRETIGGAAFDAFVADFELDETVRDIVRRQMRVSRYLDGRFRLAAKPRDADVTVYATAHADTLPHERTQALTEARERLTRERFDQLSSSFIADLRRRARVRVLHAPSAPPGATPLNGIASASDTSGVGAGR